MKSFGFIVLLFFVMQPARAELDTLWSQQIDLSSFQWVQSAIILQNGHTMVASAHNADAGIDLWRLNATGSQVWNGTVSFQGDYCTLLGMEQFEDGQIALVGVVTSDNDSLPSLSVLRINDVGAVQGEISFDLDIAYPENKAGICATRDNGLVLYTGMYDNSGSQSDLLIKFDSNGDTLWTASVSGQGGSQGACVQEFANGDLAVAGWLTTDAFTFDAFVARTTPTGSTVWMNDYPSPDIMRIMPQAIALDDDENIYVAGNEGFDFGIYWPWAYKLTSSGNYVWTLTGLDGEFFGISGIRPTDDGGATVCGSTASEVGPFTGRIYTLNSSGNSDHSAELSADGVDLRGMHNRGSAGLIFGTTFQSTDYAARLYRFGPGYIVNGIVRAQGTNEPLSGVRVEVVETGDFTITDEQGAYLLGTNQSEATLLITGPCIAPDSQSVELVLGGENVVDFTVGTPQYENNKTSVNIIGTFGRWERDTLTVQNDGDGLLQFTCETVEHTPTYGWLYVAPESGEIAAGASGEIVVSVLTNPEHPESEFFGEVIIHHNACPDTADEVGVYILALDSPDRPDLAESFVLYPAYPNPFNAVTRVAFDLPQTSHVSAKLYTIEGREAATLADDVFDAGVHSLLVDRAAFATGVYLLRVSAGSFVETQKLVLLK
ncbi:MAG: T9SS type A sorting domain-containing protein [Calditrichaeota bacterium]|nr:T9SS type A sorting domain-containing protein [Calditrichota bacterium]MCB9369781.1 T9SS type A sorting domain-containing protein [Calditrichota bacterium]